MPVLSWLVVGVCFLVQVGVSSLLDAVLLGNKTEQEADGPPILVVDFFLLILSY